MALGFLPLQPNNNYFIRQMSRCHVINILCGPVICHLKLIAQRDGPHFLSGLAILSDMSLAPDNFVFFALTGDTHY